MKKTFKNVKRTWQV